jgi:hypothetical protein
VDAALHRVPVEAGSAEIEAAVRHRHPDRADRLFTYRNACGTYLGRLAKKYPEHLESLRGDTRRTWLMRPEFLSRPPGSL